MTINRTVTVPAAVNGQSGIYREDVKGLRYFTCLQVVGTIRVRLGDGPDRVIGAGETAAYPADGFVIYNERPIAITVKFEAGDQNIQPKSVTRADAAGEYGTNTFLQDYVDGALAVAALETAVVTLAIPDNQPFRTIWLYYHNASLVPGNYSDLVFYKDGAEVLRLPAWHKPTGTTNYGLASNPNGSANNDAAPFAMTWNNTDGGGYYRLKPFKLSVIADQAKIVHIAAAGTVRAFLAVLSGDQPI